MYLIILSEILHGCMGRISVVKHSFLNWDPHTTAIFWMFQVLYCLQILIEWYIFTITPNFLFFSESTWETLNETLGVLVMLSLPSLAAKLFLFEIKCYFNSVYFDDNFMKLSIKYDDYQPIHFSMQVLMFLLILFAPFLLMDIHENLDQVV